MRNRNPFNFLLIPFSWIYGLIIFIRNFLFDNGILPEKEFDIPVISVGNITVGGTGKTPHVEYLIKLLKDEFKVATLSRGYKRETKGFIIAGNNTSPAEAGDEPCQIKSKFPDLLVAADADRINGIQQILEADNETDVIILDDAFQHRYVKPGICILLVDYNRPINRDMMLPAGRLREPQSGKRRAHIIVVTKSPENISPIDKRLILKDIDPAYYQHLYFSSVKYGEPKSVYSDYDAPTTSDLINRKPSILLVCGIANPGNLRRYSETLSPDIKEMFFPDHHAFTMADISDITNRFNSLPGKDKILITTEKDSIRLRIFDDFPNEIKHAMYYIPISVVMNDADRKCFNNVILGYVRNNKRNSIFHTAENRYSTGTWYNSGNRPGRTGK